MSDGPEFAIFLDANVLAKPVTRTLLMIAGQVSGYGTTWSAYVEDEANRHLRSGQTSVTEMRTRASQQLSGPGHDPQRFACTAASDRQVLADVEAAQAQFIVSEDVDDFGESDLASLGVTVVNPDLFLSTRTTAAAYLDAVRFLAQRSNNPHRTPEDFHRALGRVHPMTVQTHRAVFPSVTPLPATHHPPRDLARGTRCLTCLSVKSTVRLGVCPDCAP